MRGIFYVALAFAVLARSNVVAAFPHPDLSKTFPDSAANAKRFLRGAGQEVAQANRGNGYGGVWKAAADSVNKIVPKPNIDMKTLLEKAKVVQALKKNTKSK
ncbi:hypothetical protein F441_15214 [Phytophthora nicotianae CJ01A1]|uniref:RxLR effector protein n=6 Tax=Phytophthora nicotianae TaxID=4792 RepID=W2PBK5_PHYN3|nr:hypothetical protein PPTG_04478 [Phytophthora nicotianae INRA-310]XP_008917345.1 hypothetical protein PPTG_20340 [Phytophthora nicotianae INRA-310]ETI38973.1 hypothetical protein F443_15390 [Phytophthora nicotianae P1569]ETK79177.1 hypothetical protein L915_14945 [Phytophthora nicotianae]ETO67716.1 hypothetical protein F444_15390 [Phytophthora nicotianae P1976]ETP08885.1 hypothetical protein F441_15214 [Phytophthora nicotianae CJ01A1]ETP36912.1 hypothetical protein F442_15232 [Phytophthora